MININRPLTVEENKFIEREMKRAKIKALKTLGFNTKVIAQKMSMKTNKVEGILKEM